MPKQVQQSPEKTERVAVESRSGRMIWLPKDEVKAFKEGQKKLSNGELPPEYERKCSEIMSALLASKNKAQEK